MLTDEKPGTSPPSPIRDDVDNGSWWRDLMDVRIVMFLVCVVVIAMTATVLTLVDDPDPASAIAPIETHEAERPTSGEDEPVLAAGNAVPEPRLPTSVVRQNGNAGFTLPLDAALVANCQLGNAGISDWQSEGSAEWTLGVSDRRKGYFRCYVTYQAKVESRFWVQLGQRDPLKLTLYPHESDFTEQMIVRLDRSAKQSFRLLADQYGARSGVTFKRIWMEPQ